MYLFCCNTIRLGRKGVLFPTPHVEQPEEPRLTVSVFLCTLEQTALLLKSFHLHLDNDTWTRGGMVLSKKIFFGKSRNCTNKRIREYRVLVDFKSDLLRPLMCITWWYMMLMCITWWYMMLMCITWYYMVIYALITWWYMHSHPRTHTHVYMYVCVYFYVLTYLRNLS